MAATTIEWTDESINPIRYFDPATGATGHYCEKISSGCAHCYASELQKRFRMPGFPGANKRFQTLPILDDGEGVSIKGGRRVIFDASRLEQVRKRRRPTRWFWCDMSDLFGSWVPDAWIDRCFGVMQMTPRHTHQVLTKRADRMAAYLAQRFPKPLANVWAGVSVEDQRAADERCPLLLRTPAAVRWLSCEPLLGAVDVSKWLRCEVCREDHPGLISDGMQRRADATHPSCGRGESCPLIRWGVIGGESGRQARECDVANVRFLVEQCKAAGVAVFVKQLGANVEATNGIDPIDQFPNDAIPRFGQGSGPNTARIFLQHSKGGDPAEWPADLRVREYPEVARA